MGFSWEHLLNKSLIHELLSQGLLMGNWQVLCKCLKNEGVLEKEYNIIVGAWTPEPDCLGLNLSSATYELCDLGRVI